MGKSIWNLRHKPYFRFSLCDSNLREIDKMFKLDKGEKWLIWKKYKVAFLIPRNVKLRTIKSMTEVIFDINSAIPLLPLESSKIAKDDKEIYELTLEYEGLLTRMAKMIKKTKSEDSETETEDKVTGKRKKSPINKKVTTYTQYTRDVPPIWLYDALKSRFVPQLLQGPKDIFTVLLPLGVVIVCVGFAIAVMWMTKSYLQPNPVVVP